jgi:hypothetical protein
MKIRHWLLPSKANKFHPHALRPIGLGIFLVLFLAIPLAYNVTATRNMQVLGYATNVSVGDLYALTNQQRANNGLPAFTLDSQLNSAAQAKANHMMANNYWAHVAPDGTTPWSFFYGAGYNFSAAGENLAKDFNSSNGVVNGWMGSPAHQANILSTAYNDIGLAVLDGVLLGSETTLVVAMYGARVSTPPPAPAAPAATTQSAEPTPTPAASEPEPTPIPEPPAAEQTSEQTASKAPETTTLTDEATQTEGQVEGLATFLPVQVYNGLNWGQKASLVLLSLLALLFIMKHTVVWRAQKKGYRHIWLRAHPLSQFAILASVATVTILTGVGVVL